MSLFTRSNSRRAFAPSFHPPLEFGDCLDRIEFEQRYAHTPQLKKAELLEGIVYMSPCVPHAHGRLHLKMASWLCLYEEETPGAAGSSSASVRLDRINETQPDLLLMDTLPTGACKIAADDHLEGPPELCVEIASSSASYDLHQKKRINQRSGVQEYLAWDTNSNEIHWWGLVEGEYAPLSMDDCGVVRSQVFPGLWLHVPAAQQDDWKLVTATLREGLDSEEHRQYAAGRK